MSEIELQALIDEIIDEYRERCYWMEQRKATDNQLRAYLRTLMGFHKSLPKAEKARIKAAAKQVVAVGERYMKDVAEAEIAATKAAMASTGSADQSVVSEIAQKIRVPLPAELVPYESIVIPTLNIRGISDRNEAEPTERLRELAHQLPVWILVKDWRGFAEVSLTTLVAEAGHDLSKFPTRNKLWKRLGLAVIDGSRQGGLRKGAPKKQWIQHGYNRKRRSRIWAAISQPMMLQRNERFRALYESRRAYELARAEAAGWMVVPAKKIPKQNAERFRSVEHVNKRARRYAEKHIICDVWRAWRRAARSAEAWREAA